MEITAQRIVKIEAGPNTEYTDDRLDGYYFNLLLTDEDGIKNKIVIHCRPDCQYTGFYRQVDLNELDKAIDILRQVIRPEAD